MPAGEPGVNSYFHPSRVAPGSPWRKLLSRRWRAGRAVVRAVGTQAGPWR